MKTMSGTCVPMITPMTESEDVDFDSLERLTEYLTGCGCSALYPCGTTGEVVNLTLDERRRIVRTVVDAARGRIPVFAQVGGLPTRDSARLAMDAWHAGADGIGILTPTYYPLDDREMLDYYIRVAGSVPKDFPVYIYGIPGMAVNRLSPSLVEKIADACENIIGIKYSVSDILTLMSFKRIRNNCFRVLVSPAQMLLPALAIGADGIVSGNCNVFSEDINEMFRLFKEKETAKCRALQERLSLIAEAMADKEAAKCKALLCRKGVIKSDAMRGPQRKLNEAEKNELFSFVDEIIVG